MLTQHWVHASAWGPGVGASGLVLGVMARGGGKGFA